MASDEGTTPEDRAFWTALAAAPVVAVLAYLGANDPSTAWRYAGGTLELAGFVLVILDLELRLERFGDRAGPLLRAGWAMYSAALHAWGWIAGLFGWEPPPESIRESFTDAVGFEDSLELEVTRGQPFPGLRGRVIKLERELDDLEDRVDRVESQAQEKRAELREDFEREIQDLRGEIGEVRSTFRESVTHGYRLEALGVGFFLAGVALGTWGPAVF